MNKNWKRGISTALTSLLLISSVPSYGASPRFKDVPTKRWSYSYVEEMAKLGYLDGKGNGVFDPAANLTFMQAMSTLSRFTNPTLAEKNSAYNAYSSLLDDLKIKQPWEREGLSISLYKGIVSENEVRNAKAKGLLNKPIQRITNTVFMAKAMGLEEAARSNMVVVLPYKDVRTIEDSSQIKYVKALLDAKILDPNGKGNGIFAPKSTLSREEMATMLSKGYNYLQKNPSVPIVAEQPKSVGTEVVKGSIKRITDEIGRKFLVMDDRFGDEVGYIIDNTTSITINGRLSNTSYLSAGQDVELIVRKNTKDLISIRSTSVDEDMKGIIKYINNNIYKMTLEYQDGNRTLSRDYDIDKKVDVYLNGKSAYLSDVKVGYMVGLKSRNNTIYDIKAKAKDQKVEGIIKDITAIKDSKDTDYYITIVDSKDISHKFLINSKTYIYRNGKLVKVGDLKLKDNTYIVAEYDVAKNIEAKVVKRDIKGYIIQITNRVNRNTLVIIKNKDTNKEETYELTRNAYIKIDNVVTSSLPNNPGYHVEITLEGDEIVEVYAETSSMETSIIGKVSYIDRKNRIIEITIDNINYENEDNSRLINVHVGKKANITFRGSSWEYDFNEIHKGDRINIVGTYEGANFVADTIQIRD